MMLVNIGLMETKMEITQFKGETYIRAVVVRKNEPGEFHRVELLQPKDGGPCSMHLDGEEW